jgi:hypothetical protein
MALATLPQAKQIGCFLHHHAGVAASPFPILSDDQCAILARGLLVCRI